MTSQLDKVPDDELKKMDNSDGMNIGDWFWVTDTDTEWGEEDSGV